MLTELQSHTHLSLNMRSSYCGSYYLRLCQDPDVSMLSDTLMDAALEGVVGRGSTVNYCSSASAAASH